MPSQADIEGYRSDLNIITAAAVAEATGIAAAVANQPAAQAEAILVVAIPQIIAPYIAGAAQLAALFYRQSGPGGAANAPATPRPGLIVGTTGRRALAAADAFRPRPAAAPPPERLEGSVRWAVNIPEGAGSTVQTRLAGAVQRHVASAARDTITQNADLEGARWYRYAQPDACAFCRLLATRGPDYLSEESAVRVVGRRNKSRRATSGRLAGVKRGTQALGEKYHDDCRCEPVAVRPGDTYEPPDYMDDWTEQYLKAAANSHGTTKSILAEMRKLSPDNKR